MTKARKRILVVENDQASGETLRDLLVEMGFDVHLVSDGESAVQDMAKFHPSIVLMDVGLHTGIMIPGGMEPIHLTHRLVMNPYVAKRLIESLRQIVVRHEQAFGPLEVDPQKRLRRQG